MDAGLAVLAAFNDQLLGLSHQEIDWTNIDDVTIEDDNVIKTSGSNWWNAGCSSNNYIPAGGSGWVEVIPQSTSGYRMFGLSPSDQGSTWNSIKYNFYLNQANLQVYQSGSYKAGVGSYKHGDVLRVERTQPQYANSYWSWDIRFTKNGEILYTISEQSPLSPPGLVVDNSLYTVGSSLENMSCSHESILLPEEGNPVTWTNKVGVSSSANTITKTNSNNWWNSGGASVEKIDSDHDGWISLDVNSVSHHRMIGLSPVDQGATWNTIKYNLYLSSYGSGDAKIYSYGTLIKEIGDYNVGDKFKIERRKIDGQGYIMFFKNDILQYGWEVEMDEDLIADACIYAPGGQITNLRIEDNGIGSMGGIAPPPGGSVQNTLSVESGESFGIDPKLDTATAEAFASKFDMREKYQNKVLINSVEEQPILRDSLIVSNPINFNYYPNPTSNFLYIESGENQDIEVWILSASTGKEIYSTTLKSNSKKVNLQNRETGLYLVKVRLGNDIYEFRVYKE